VSSHGVGLFVYGTLTCPELLAALVGRTVSALDARLEDYERRTLRMPELAPVPAIVPHAGHRVAGRLVEGLDDAALGLLDDFELSHADFYVRRDVVVDTAAGRRRAQAYVAGPAVRRYLAEPWNREAFLREYGDLYREQVIPAFLASRGGGQAGG
jgi:gamma-glutamylcyclotransferase (GGCT)/AIG2-like uncharacterized protein YtfP